MPRSELETTTSRTIYLQHDLYSVPRPWPRSWLHTPPRWAADLSDVVLTTDTIFRLAAEPGRDCRLEYVVPLDTPRLRPRLTVPVLEPDVGVFLKVPKRRLMPYGIQRCNDIAQNEINASFWYDIMQMSYMWFGDERLVLWSHHFDMILCKCHTCDLVMKDLSYDRFFHSRRVNVLEQVGPVI